MKTLNIKIKGEQIQEKEYKRYLEILIDNKLSWNCHIKHANLKISKGIRILTKLRRYLSKCVLRTLFYAFVEIHIRGVATNSGLVRTCVSGSNRDLFCIVSTNMV